MSSSLSRHYFFLKLHNRGILKIGKYCHCQKIKLTALSFWICKGRSELKYKNLGKSMMHLLKREKADA